jgi:hypothetical protein
MAFTVEGTSSGGGCVFGERWPAVVPRIGQRVPGGVERRRWVASGGVGLRGKKGMKGGHR